MKDSDTQIDYRMRRSCTWILFLKTKDHWLNILWTHILKQLMILKVYYLCVILDSEKNLFLFYAGYRSIIRAKVYGIQSIDKKCPLKDIPNFKYLAHRHWNLALNLLSPNNSKSAVILVVGLPCSGYNIVIER